MVAINTASNAFSFNALKKDNKPTSVQFGCGLHNTPKADTVAISSVHKAYAENAAQRLAEQGKDVSVDELLKQMTQAGKNETTKATGIKGFLLKLIGGYQNRDNKLMKPYHWLREKTGFMTCGYGKFQLPDWASKQLGVDYTMHCSEVMAKGIQELGVIKGIALGTYRLAMCNPLTMIYFKVIKKM